MVVSIGKYLFRLGFQNPLPLVSPFHPLVFVREQETQGLILSDFGEFKVWKNLILRSDFQKITMRRLPIISGCLPFKIFLCIKQCLKWSEVTQSCPTLCDPMDCSLSGSTVHGVFQAIVLEWIAISFSRGSSHPRGWTRVSRIVDRHFTIWATWQVLTKCCDQHVFSFC